MKADSIHFKGHRCFKNEWAGFNSIKPINVIIGRNNTGKSHLLDLVAAICTKQIKGRGWKFRCSGTLDEISLKSYFHQNTSHGDLPGNHWRENGKMFLGATVEWEIDENFNTCACSLPANLTAFCAQDARKGCLPRINELVKNFTHELSGTSFHHLLADRDIRPEQPNNDLKLQKDGTGATNIIRRYILTSNPQFPRELIQQKLLAGLNKIFARDGHFTEIQVKHHDDSGDYQGQWEVFLGEEKKGLIPLSNSGSGLKTVILVLLHLLVVPEFEKEPKENLTFAFEELENNLHPALLRRLFQYLENYALSERCRIFLTTHSSTALDLFGVSPNAQIIHVSHDGEAARATTVAAHFDHLGVISELGAKPSDLLQANGIIWVEGPSDCIYINRWLDIFTEGRFQEGRDYICAYYGGSLLARTQFRSPEDAEKELVNLLRVNPNIIVVCDGDRSRRGAQIKDRVRRIQSEVQRINNAHSWVTSAREIENYVPGSVLAKTMGFSSLPDPGQFEAFFPRKGLNSSYLTNKLKRKTFDKMDLAVTSAPHMDKTLMKQRFDWQNQMEQIAERIARWNA